MILYYAMGGGLGHLTRFRAVCKTLQFNEKLSLITSSPNCKNPDIISPEIQTIIPPFYAANSPETMGAWLTEVVAELKPSKIYLDAFPAGILGEFCHIEVSNEIEFFNLARILKWDIYKPRLGELKYRFKKAFLLEELSLEHMAFLANNSSKMEKIKLDLPEKREINIDIPDGAWIIIHAGTHEETLKLVAHAKSEAQKTGIKPVFVLIAPEKPPRLTDDGILYLDVYPAYSLFEKAGKVISGAGFNMVDQMREMRHKHIVLPFDRVFDDQSLRASRLD
jgi:predicted glycosyltransferase